MRFQDRKINSMDAPTVISIASLILCKRNQHLMCRIVKRLDLNMNDQKVRNIHSELSEYEIIAA